MRCSPTAGDIWRQPAYPTQVVDTLGAGDAFIARVLVGIVRDEPFDVSLATAAQVAATTCASYGAFGHENRGRPARADDHRWAIRRGTGQALWVRHAEEDIS